MCDVLAARNQPWQHGHVHINDPVLHTGTACKFATSSFSLLVARMLLVVSSDALVPSSFLLLLSPLLDTSHHTIPPRRRPYQNCVRSREGNVLQPLVPFLCKMLLHTAPLNVQLELLQHPSSVQQLEALEEKNHLPILPTHVRTPATCEFSSTKQTW